MPPPTQAACASMEWRFFQRQGYEVAEGELPVRPLRTRFIPLAEHLDEKRLVSRVTYRLSTYPQKDRPFIFSNRREEDGCYAAYVASLVPAGEWFLFSNYYFNPYSRK